jgi:hypothetical protein
MLLRSPIIMALASFVVIATAPAHPIPTLVVEADFAPDRTVEVRVNMDPRLFLAAVPSTLPPVPGSWWLDQDEPSRAKTADLARNLLERTLYLQTGPSALQTQWEIVAIESNLATPLTSAVAEVHLLARAKAPLAPEALEFTVTLAREAAVPLILVNRVMPDGQPQPQSIFPGESSRAFPLPAAPMASLSPLTNVADASSATPAPSSASLTVRFALAAALLAALLLLAKIGMPGRKEKAIPDHPKPTTKA